MNAATPKEVWVPADSATANDACGVEERRAAAMERLRAAARFEREREERREIERALREARAAQRAIERDRVAVKRRGAPLQSSGGVTYPGRPRR